MGKKTVKEKLDIESQESQEELDRLKTEERGQRKLNDALYSDNRKLKKENKDLKGSNEDILKRVESKKASLRKINDVADNKEKCIHVFDTKITKANKDLDLKLKDATARVTLAEEAEGKATEAKASTDKARSILKGERDAFNTERKAVAQHKKDYAKLINDAEVEKGKAVKLVAEKEEVLLEWNKKVNTLDKSISEATDVKEQYLSKKQDCISAENAQLALNAEVTAKQKALDALAEDLKKEIQATQDARTKVESTGKGMARMKKEFEIRNQEVETLELQVKKIIRDKKIGTDLAKLKKDMAK